MLLPRARDLFVCNYTLLVVSKSFMVLRFLRCMRLKQCLEYNPYADVKCVENDVSENTTGRLAASDMRQSLLTIKDKST